MMGERHADLLARLAVLAPAAGPLERVCIGSLDILGVTGAAVVLMSEQEVGAVVASAGGHVRTIEDLQFTFGEGPCIEAHHGGVPVLAPELLDGAMARWPVFAPAAIESGARAVFVLPLQLGGIRLGVLYLYRDRPGALDGDQLGASFSLAEIATLLLLEEQIGDDPGGVGDGLAGSWSTRLVVHQATGMAAVQLDVRLIDALARLRAYAFSEDRTIYDVAVDVVARRIRLEP